MNRPKQLTASLKKQWKRYRRELKRCQDKFSEKAIHVSRVETRRLLSTVELLGGFIPAGRVGKAKRALKQHLDTFDDLRDTQVQLLITGKMLRAYPAARPFHAYLLKREARFARQTRKQIKGIKTSRLGKLIAACREDITTRCQPRAPSQTMAMLLRRVNRAFARTRQLWTRINPRDTETIHRTRVAFKKFRYMVEALADYLPLADERRLAAMHHYQTLMGDIQDAEVLLAALDKFFHKKEIATGPARRFHEELVRRRKKLIRIYLASAAHLLEFWPLPPSKTQ